MVNGSWRAPSVRWKFLFGLRFPRHSISIVSFFMWHFMWHSKLQCMWCSYHAAPLSVFRSWDGSIFNNENWHADSDFAHEENESRRPDKPKWGDGDISLVLNCVSRQYSCIPFGTRAKFKLSLQYGVLYLAETCEPGHRSGQVIYPRELMIKIHFS